MRKAWLLLAIPLILGCIMGGGEEDIEFAGCVPEVTNGLAITSFEPDLGEIYSNDDVTLTLELENLGGSKATGIEAEILNYGALKLSGGESIIQTVSDMETQGEGMPPVTDQADWTMIPEGTGTAGTETVTPAATVSYDYTSTGIAMLKFIPKSDWRDMRQEGETVTIAKTCSNGPLTVSVAPLRVPITEDSGEFTTQVVIKNIGGGTVRTGAIDQLGTITLTLPTGGELKVGSVCDFTGTPLTATDKLNRNGELTLTCKLTLDEGVAQTVREADYEVKVEVEYTYVIDGTTSVAVREEAATLSMKVLDPKPTEWPTGDSTISVVVDPQYNGESICTKLAARTTTDFTASVKNDKVLAQPSKTVAPADVTCSNEELTVVIRRPANYDDPDEGWDSKIYGPDAVLTLVLDYSNKKASVTVEGITVTE